MSDSRILSLAMLSHELKNSLTLMKSTMQLIGIRYPDIVNDAMWQEVRMEFEHMTRLISEISNMENTEDRRNEKIDVWELFMELEKMFAAEIYSGKKEIIFRKGILKLYMYGNRLMLRQLFINLIQNALEATEEGDCIEISADAKNGNVVFEICDTGIGMDSEIAASIFEPFVTHKKDGTGLGMVVVKNIVDAHEGNIRVKSIRDQGTEIIVEFPIRYQNKEIL